MAYINCGVKIAGERLKYKKELKDAVEKAIKDPEFRKEIVFDCTSLFEGRKSIEGTLMQGILADGHVLSVTGPDPYIRRSWHASIRATTKGIEVS